MDNRLSVKPISTISGERAPGERELRGVAHLRYKESDRLALLAENLTRLGRPATALEDRLEVGAAAPESLRGATIRTADDHRMAMAFAIAGQRLAGVRIDNAQCVAKSYPEFWERLAAARGD